MQLKEAAAELASRTEQVTTLETELASIKETLEATLALASSHTEALAKIEAAAKESEESKAKLEDEIHSLKGAAGNAVGDAAEHARIQEEVCFTI